MADKTIKFKDDGECPAARGVDANGKNKGAKYTGGEERTISEEVARDLVKRGVATYVKPTTTKRKDKDHAK